MTRRSFAGYTYQHKLRSGCYGDIYRANTAGGHEAWLLEIDADLASIPGFAESLTTLRSELDRLSHAHTVETRSMGRTPEGKLVVVTEAVAARASIEELLQRNPSQGLPQAIAAGIGKQLLDGLAGAHRLGIVHGAIHPRSVLIDDHGTVKLDDFAVGQALSAAIANEVTSPLRDSLDGYLAPEVARGKPATKAADVYSAAAVVYVMLSGTLPPGTLDISPGFERMIQRALDASLARRYPTAEEFFENFVEALEDDLWAVASDVEIGAYVADVMAAPLPQGADEKRGISELSSLLSELSEDHADHGDQRAASASARRDPGDSGVDALLAELDPPTQVDPMPLREITRDPISELIALSPNKAVPGVRVIGAPATQPATPLGQSLGPRWHGQPGTPDAAAAALEAIADLDSEPAAAPDPDVARAALDAIAGLADSPSGSVPRAPSARPVSAPPASPSSQAPRAPSAPSASPSSQAPRAPSAPAEAARPVSAQLEPVRAPSVLPEPVRAPSAPPEPARSAPPAPPTPRQVAAAPLIDDLDPGLDVSLKKSSFLGRLLWFLIAAGGVGALVWVVMHQSSLREQAERDRERQKAENEATLAAFRSSQPKSGQVSIDSKPGEAAVWMLLGRTPLDTNPMSTAMPHELRVEFEGHAPKDVHVSTDGWSGSGESMKASVRVKLTPGTPGTPVPAYPPEPPPAANPPKNGQGSIHVESEPPGAQVWLLVGFTPGATITGYAGIDYEFKLTKDGHLPGYATIKATDWKGTEGEQLSRNVTLQPVDRREQRRGH